MYAAYANRARCHVIDTKTVYFKVAAVYFNTYTHASYKWTQKAGKTGFPENISLLSLESVSKSRDQWFGAALDWEHLRGSSSLVECFFLYQTAHQASSTEIGHIEACDWDSENDNEQRTCESPTFIHQPQDVVANMLTCMQSIAV